MALPLFAMDSKWGDVRSFSDEGKLRVLTAANERKSLKRVPNYFEQFQSIFFPQNDGKLTKNADLSF